MRYVSLLALIFLGSCAEREMTQSQEYRTYYKHRDGEVKKIEEVKWSAEWAPKKETNKD